MVKLREEYASDRDAIEQLLDSSFGPNRFAKASYRFRQDVPCEQRLSLVAVDETDRLVGTIRYWPVTLAQNEALLLGPIAVDPTLHGRGVGRALVFTSLTNADSLGFDTIFLVGDPAYYERFGFNTAPAHIQMPNESPERLHYRLLGGATLPSSPCTLTPKFCAAA